MGKTLGLAAVLFVVVAAPTVGAQEDMAGKWVARAWGGRMSATVKQKGNAFEGVAIIYKPFGGKGTYVFTGTINGNKVVGRHPNGHWFKGTIISANKVTGVLTTRDGYKLRVTARRK